MLVKAKEPIWLEGSPPHYWRKIPITLTIQVGVNSVSVRFGIRCGLVHSQAMTQIAKFLRFTRQFIVLRFGAPLTDEIKSQLFVGKSEP